MKSITVTTTVHTSKETVWEYWTEPKHIVNWNFASDDWESPAAKNDLRKGGKFCYTMAAKDKSAQFDFTGTYTNVKKYELIEYTMDDGRKAQIHFTPHNHSVKISETFDMESSNSEELQRKGWQAILDNFKKYVEENTS
jgi:uncharacterized protein YndB with AHSA1/START domain